MSPSKSFTLIESSSMDRHSQQTGRLAPLKGQINVSVMSMHFGLAIELHPTQERPPALDGWLRERMAAKDNWRVNRTNVELVIFGSFCECRIGELFCAGGVPNPER